MVSERLLVVTGAAGAGKSTVGRALAGEPGFLVVDGDVIASGAASVAEGSKDYLAFWSYVRRLAREIHRNGLTPVISCVSLPSQLLPSHGEEPMRIAVLALVADAGTLAARRAERTGEDQVDPAKHQAIDGALRVASMPEPHSIELLDTTGQRPDVTIEHARRWALALCGDT